VKPGRAAAAALALLACGCTRQAAEGKGSADPLAAVRSLLSERRYDEVLARLGDASDPDSAYLAGRAWAGKAESAPLPTPGPGGPDTEALKPEEQRAIDLYERAVAARPDFAEAHRAIADLLAPHAIASVAAAHAAARGPRHAKASALAPAASALVDRVLKSYGQAVQSDLAGTEAASSLIAFAVQVGRLADADAAYQELVRRNREDPTYLVRYGDFLAGTAGKPDAALAQYSQALILKPDDTATRLKIAEIHLEAAAALLRDRQYIQAEARVKDARRYVVDRSSPQAAQLAELEAQLREVRGR
jgi:tetratricopeptide (TPR) repeat protein